MELREFFKQIKKRWWIPVLLVMVLSAVAYFTTPNPTTSYEATTTVLLSQGNDTLPDPSEISTGQRVATTYANLMTTQSIMAQVASNLGLSTTPEGLASQIQVRLIEDTNLMEVSATSAEPEQAVAIANEVVRVFVEANSSLQTQRYTATRTSLENDIAALEQTLEERRTEAYQQDLVVSEIENAIAALNRREVEGILTAEQAQQRDDLQQQLAQERIEQDQIQSDLNRLQTRYQTLLSSLEEIRLLEAQGSDFMSIVEPATSARTLTSPPRKVINASQAGIAGAVFGLGIIFLIEQLRTSITKSEEVERIAGVPMLGFIADIKGSKPQQKVVAIEQPRSPIAEAYRVIRTNLEFTERDSPTSTILVTSSSPAEGKTVTTANLAATIAQGGKSVILVDTDLRRPSLHKLFSAVNTRGVTTALSRGDDSPLTDHIQVTDVKDLYLMPSGPLPPNPADILGSPQMKRLIEELKGLADVIVFDSPPTLAVADSTLLARVCDVTLLVVLHNSTRADTLRNATDRLRQSGANMVGAVLNKVSASDDGYYQYYYYSQN